MERPELLSHLHQIATDLEGMGLTAQAAAAHAVFVRVADWDDDDWDGDNVEEARDRIFNPKGEWWLHDGNATFADGDIGDFNHADLAEDEIFRRLGYDLNTNEGFPTTRYNTSYDFENARKGNFRNGWDPAHIEEAWNRFVAWAQATYGEEHLDELDYKDYIRWMHSHGLPEEARMSPEEVKRHLNGLKDSRGHAIEHFGWAAVRNNEVEIWDLSPDSLGNLENGLWDAYGEDVQKMKFNVEVRKLGKYLTDIPFSEIEDGSIRKHLREVQMPSETTVVNRRMEYTNPYANDPIEGIRRMYRYPGASVLTSIHRMASLLEEEGLEEASDLMHAVFVRVAKNHGGLDDWFENERWRDLRRPKKGGGYEPCGRSNSKGGKKPVCVPANKAKNLTKKERAQRLKEKAKKEKEPNPDKKPNTTQYSEGAGGKSNVS